MSILRSSIVVSILTFGSRILGLLRDLIIAYTFGATPLTDAFWVAFRIPNLFRRLFAEGAFSQAFIPILSSLKESHEPDVVQRTINHVALVLSSVLIVFTLAGIIFAPVFVMLIASGFTGEHGFHATVIMTRIMFPYIFCMSLTALASGILNTWSRFAIPAFTPMLLNLSMIFCSLFLVSYFSVPIYALACGVIIGGVLQLLTQWLALMKLGLEPRFHRNLKQAITDPYVITIMRKMVPAIIGVSVAQISLLINTNIASWLQKGSVSWLSFADRLMEFPTALLGVAFATVLLPYLSRAYSDKNQDRYNHLMDWGLRLMLLLGLPAAVGMALLAPAIISVLFNYGHFNAFDVQQTAHAVMAYSFGIIGLLGVKILAPGFYAQQDMVSPVKIAVIVLIATQIMNAIFVPYLHHVGLVLSISFAALLNSTLLYTKLRRYRLYVPQRPLLPFVLRLIPALLVLALFLYTIQSPAQWTDPYHTHSLILWLSQHLHDLPKSFFIARVLALFIIILGAMICYFGALYLSGLRLHHFMRRQSSGA